MKNQFSEYFSNYRENSSKIEYKKKLNTFEKKNWKFILCSNLSTFLKKKNYEKTKFGGGLRPPPISIQRLNILFKIGGPNSEQVSINGIFHNILFNNPRGLIVGCF